MFFRKNLKKNQLSELYKSLIEGESLCFDIGANIGYKSTVLLNLGHKVVGFEPQENCHEALMQIEKTNTNFKLAKLAIGSDNTEKELWIGNHKEIATLSSKFKDYFTTSSTYWDDKIRVKVATLNSQIKIYGIPEFCKIDTEGYEYEILKNLSHKIRVIEFEFTDGFIKETINCINALKNLGDYHFNYILNEKPELKLKIWTSANEISSKLELLKTKNLHGNIFAKLN